MTITPLSVQFRMGWWPVQEVVVAKSPPFNRASAEPDKKPSVAIASDSPAIPGASANKRL
jgi:hypothetical protein